MTADDSHNVPAPLTHGAPAAAFGINQTTPDQTTGSGSTHPLFDYPQPLTPTDVSSGGSSGAPTIRMQPGMLIDAAGGLGALAGEIENQSVDILSPSLDMGDDAAKAAIDDFGDKWTTGLVTILRSQADIENGLRAVANEILRRDVDAAYRARYLGRSE